MTIQRMFADVEEFHAAMGLYPFNSIEVSYEDVEKKRKRLISEETKELDAALEIDDDEEILHETLDKIYVDLGLLVERGYTAAQVAAGWELIQAANMAKEPPEHPLGKPTKPEGWEPADMKRALEAKQTSQVWLVSLVSDQGFSTQLVSIEGPMTNSKLTTLCAQFGAAIIAMSPIDDKYITSFDNDNDESEEEDKEDSELYVPTIDDINKLMEECPFNFYECRQFLFECGSLDEAIKQVKSKSWF